MLQVAPPLVARQIEEWSVERLRAVRDEVYEALDELSRPTLLVDGASVEDGSGAASEQEAEEITDE